MTSTSTSRPAEGTRFRGLNTIGWERWALPAILLLAAVNFAWQLGSSSYFTDEAFSVLHSLPAFGGMFHRIVRAETTPYTYFLFLHEWLRLTGSEAEWVTRLPSAVAGVALVGASYWMAGAFVARRAALGVAALCALSPLIQSYAQETRVYVFGMLALVVAVGATVRATQRVERRTWMLVLGAAMSFLALWLHYTALEVVLPLIVWVATRSQLSRRARAAFVLTCVVGQATLMPLLLQQYHYNPNGGAILGAVNLNNIVSVVGTPFGLRVGTPVNVRTVAGALIVIGAVPALLLGPHRDRIAERGLLVVLAVFGVIALLGIDLTGKHILITRYTAVTAPLLVMLVVGACVALPLRGGVTLAAAAVAVSIAGLVVNHSPSGFYAPAREVIDYIAPRERRGDFMLTPGIPLTDTPIFYYDTRRTHPKLHFVGYRAAAAQLPFRHRRRIWIVVSAPGGSPAAAVRLASHLTRRYGYRLGPPHLYTTSITLAVMLARPR